MTTTKPFTKTQEARYARLLKGNAPRWIRCYDNGGKSCDRYTVVFSKQGKCHHPYLAMSARPFHPQGFGQHGESKTGQPIDRPAYSHLGKKIAFHTLPEDCQRAVLQDYADYWDIPLSRLLSDCLGPSE